MDVSEELFVPVYYSLLIMKKNNDTAHNNNETSAKAEPLFKLVHDFEFVVTLVVTRSILHYLLPVARKLQAKDVDVAQSKELVQSLRGSHPAMSLKTLFWKYAANLQENTQAEMWFK